ncbi:hypothetical protein Fot_16645 [Forsythia ovata]|uniref:Uncharacterized protein n=1 Tax=Forsythia ovata TaxID=205694 RepID=A0ABD1VD37_9LAMI
MSDRTRKKKNKTNQQTPFRPKFPQIAYAPKSASTSPNALPSHYPSNTSYISSLFTTPSTTPASSHSSPFMGTETLLSAATLGQSIPGIGSRRGAHDCTRDNFSRLEWHRAEDNDVGTFRDFAFVVPCFVYGVVSSVIGKTPYLSFVAEAVNRQLE